MLKTRIKKDTFLLGVIAICGSSPMYASLIPPSIHHGISTEDLDKSLQVQTMESPFIKNEGQADSRISFYRSTTTGMAFVTTSGELLYTLNQRANRRSKQKMSSFRVQFKGGRASPVGLGKYNPLVNFYLGNDVRKSRNNLPIYAAVKLGEVWPGIDVSLQPRNARVGKFFEVQPGGDVSLIRMQVSRTESLKVHNDGRLIVSTAAGSVIFSEPHAYQFSNGQKIDVPIVYQIDNLSYGFKVENYNPEVSLFIDPLIMIGDEES